MFVLRTEVGVENSIQDFHSNKEHRESSYAVDGNGEDDCQPNVEVIYEGLDDSTLV